MKPQLLSNDEYDLSTLDYKKDNWYISIKRDGVRAEITNKGIKNRSLKILRNSKIQEYFKKIYESLPDDIILEAEIYADSTPCREMAGICNSLDKDVPEDTKLYIFGMYHPTRTFEERKEELDYINVAILPMDNTKFKIVEQILVHSYKEVMKYYNSFIEQGFEGAVLMNGSGKYKEGRVTVKQQIGYKIKPIREDDLEIVGVTERMENTNESQTNELGRSYKRNTVANKIGTSIAAAFICKLPNGNTTKVTITGTEETRREIWKNKTNYIGSYTVVKSMDYGAKTKLRHPRLIKIKNKIEK